VAKAALDASMRYLAWDLGAKNIRINAVSAGPVRTLAARSIAGFPTMEAIVEERSPLHRHIDADDVGAAAAHLLSDDARNVTGTTLYVDSGYHAMGMRLSATGRRKAKEPRADLAFVTFDFDEARHVDGNEMPAA